MSEQTQTAAQRGRPKDLAKRQAILDAAKELFLTKGFAATSVDAVASAAGVSKLTVYSHFSDKETLFSAAITSRCEMMMPLPIFDLKEGDSVAEVLERIGQAFLSMVDSEDSIRLLRLLCALAAQESKLAQLFFDAGPQRILRDIEQLLRRATEMGKLQVADPAEAAEDFMGILLGCRHMRVLIGCCEVQAEDERRERVRKAVALFMRGYR
ncbi:TetR/AcrR family transcriptional regulator [Microbulbifer variabilis]|jgi:TetR/AcrR family transcriptional repressor of mexJK operon|uniref:TetR/AcrR family transcriptional regulator n=1 Tax=Microbulbifer variabilis TaxID=266805 RepID=A0ABY4V944_9GAMM|nr:TetR/AcrR family transcriptional regulator [Microbulbifer variabilis]USD20809.1 TetR/AcrR family transcriptional regulator [Microbulbifer variabilis]